MSAHQTALHTGQLCVTAIKQITVQTHSWSNTTSVYVVHYYNQNIWYIPGCAGSPFVSGPLGSVCSSTPSAPPGPLESGSLRMAAPCPGSGSDTGWHTHWSGSTLLIPNKNKQKRVKISKRERDKNPTQPCST